ncbi:hypothetical protein PENSOL_c003G00209 [Penicillium solitum]|uniref:Uncharacterized protein n=1 Tax=Penicillium solitum TaxID=60172 RepID=A0A1V6RJ92_9EURO|nr:uncharacterized protein PENSOL_c003G00209 [Penicillium solitum]OQE01875.1 hypothetical protein PENSOL_c003G00209 [Penicillium solitum]
MVGAPVYAFFVGGTASILEYYLTSLIGLEILIGVGGGSGVQQAYLVAQPVLATQDVAIGLAVIVLA